MKNRSSGVLAGLVLSLLGLAQPAVSAPGSFITIVPIVTSGLSAPIGVTNAGDGSGRLFIVQQCGQIRILSGGTLLATPFLDIGSTGTNLILCGGERGLLGLAFHPDYESNGFFYVYYTRAGDGTIVVARYQVSGNPNVANSASGNVLLTIPHPVGNHNGGQIAFGPDGFLYAATGDGGGGGDAEENGQNINALLGKILRLDVDGDDFPADPNRDYAIPGGNPFAGTAGADEIWDYGLRNPWRFSFDRQTGDLFIGDVGQNIWEEIDLHAAASPGGMNFGWDCREGAHNFADPNGDMNVNCGPVISVDPIMEYDHSLGNCSVTGGFVFRNLPLHARSGDYFFSDACSGRIWRGELGGGAWTRIEVFDTAFGVSSFGESETGRIFFTDLNGNTMQWLAPYTFADVTPSTFGWAFIEAIFAAGITSGCGGDNFCPNAPITRDQMAVFLLIAAEGPGFTPPPCTTPMFNDVPCSSPFAPWINELARRGVTAGCGGGNYCPGGSVTRNEMAVFLLATLGVNPPACTTPTFGDVPCSSPFGRWVNEIARRGITAGCGGGNYCPGNAVNRAQMAVFLATAFGLPVP